MKSKLISVILGVLVIIGIAIFGNMCRIKYVDVVFSEGTPVAKADEIYSVLGIETGTSVLSVNEIDFKTRILKAYPDRSVEIVDVVRSFPDKMTVYIDYNPAVLAVARSDGSGYVLTDTEFQSYLHTSESDLDKNSLIIVKGLNVSNTFNSDPFREMYEMFGSLTAAGASSANLPSMFSSLTVEKDAYVFACRENNAFTLTIPRSERLYAAKYFDEYVEAYLSETV